MKWLITGVPGTGKSALARWLSKAWNARVWNDKAFCEQHHIGSVVRGELVVSLPALRRKALAELKKADNIILEGHLWCEVSLPLDGVLVLHAAPRVLEQRLRKRGYSWEKVLDNTFLELEDYCGQQAQQHYPKAVIVHAAESIALKKLGRQIMAWIPFNEGKARPKH